MSVCVCVSVCEGVWRVCMHTHTHIPSLSTISIACCWGSKFTRSLSLDKESKKRSLPSNTRSSLIATVTMETLGRPGPKVKRTS